MLHADRADVKCNLSTEESSPPKDQITPLCLRYTVIERVIIADPVFTWHIYFPVIRPPTSLQFAFNEHLIGATCVRLQRVNKIVNTLSFFLSKHISKRCY